MQTNFDLIITAAGIQLIVPRLPELLADPAFSPLADWFIKRQVAVAEVQSAVDQSLEMARQATFGKE